MPDMETYDDGGFGGSYADNGQMPGGMDMMGGGDPMMGGMPQDGQNPFDTNFDAGVEANEETDPKKYIQQLTGKLSQSLRSYNEGQPQPDADLSKYVAGMIVKQAIDGLPQEDVEDILSKVKNGEDPEQPQDDTQMPNDQMGGDMNMQQPPMDDGMDMGQQPMPQGQMESWYRRGRSLKETIAQQNIANSRNDGASMVSDISFNKKPFTAPRWQ